MDSLEEELLLLANSDPSAKAAPVAAPEMNGSSNDDGWVEVGKKNKQVVTRTVRLSYHPVPRNVFKKYHFISLNP